MNQNTSRLVTFVTEAEHEKLRLEAAYQRTSLAAYLRKIVGSHVAGLAEGNQDRLGRTMGALRKVTGPTSDEDKARVQDYVDAIETELDRIKKDRGLR